MLMYSRVWGQDKWRGGRSDRAINRERRAYGAAEWNPRPMVESRTWNVIFGSMRLTSSCIGALTGLFTRYGITHHINYVSSSSREVDPFLWPLNTLDTTSSRMVLVWLISVDSYFDVLIATSGGSCGTKSWCFCSDYPGLGKFLQNNYRLQQMG